MKGRTWETTTDTAVLVPWIRLTWTPTRSPRLFTTSVPLLPGWPGRLLRMTRRARVPPVVLVLARQRTPDTVPRTWAKAVCRVVGSPDTRWRRVPGPGSYRASRTTWAR